MVILILFRRLGIQVFVISGLRIMRMRMLQRSLMS